MDPARVSVLPTWNANGDVPKSTDPPLVEAPYGAVEFSLWKEIGEKFLLTSTGKTTTSVEYLRVHTQQVLCVIYNQIECPHSVQLPTGTNANQELEVSLAGQVDL